MFHKIKTKDWEDVEAAQKEKEKLRKSKVEIINPKVLKNQKQKHAKKEKWKKLTLRL